jgi:hypothetical protein
MSFDEKKATEIVNCCKKLVITKREISELH